jgi:arylsulfatase
MITSWPEVIKKTGEMSHQPGHIIDIMATVCDISGADYPQTYKNNPITPSEGKSLLPIFQGKTREPHDILCWEHIGSVGIRKGDWKLVAARKETWELYDLSVDRTELNNLIMKEEEKARALHAEWLRWANSCGVKISDLHLNL